MKRSTLLVLAAASLLATPLLAGPPVRRPWCQAVKAPLRDVRRLESCRRQAIPPVIDPTPLFLVSTGASRSTISSLS